MTEKKNSTGQQQVSGMVSSCCCWSLHVRKTANHLSQTDAANAQQEASTQMPGLGVGWGAVCAFHGTLTRVPTQLRTVRGQLST